MSESDGDSMFTSCNWKNSSESFGESFSGQWLWEVFAITFPMSAAVYSRKSLSHDRSVPTWFQHNNWPPLSRSRLVTSDTAPCDWTWTCMHNLLFLTKPLSDQIGRPRQRIPNVPHDRHPGASQRIVLSTARDCRPRPQRRRQVEHTERAECWLAIWPWCESANCQCMNNFIANEGVRCKSANKWPRENIA